MINISGNFQSSITSSNIQKANMVWSDSSQCSIQVERLAVNICSQQVRYLWPYSPASRLVDLFWLHSADDHTNSWLQNVAVKAFAKWNELRDGNIILSVDSNQHSKIPRLTSSMGY